MFRHDVANWTEMWIIIPYSAFGPPLEGTTSIRRPYSFQFHGIEMLREYGFEIEWKTIGVSAGVQVGKVVEASFLKAKIKHHCCLQMATASYHSL